MRGNAVGELWFFIAARLADWGRGPNPRSLSLWGPGWEELSRSKKRLQKPEAAGWTTQPRGCRRRSGCASAEPYPASERGHFSGLPCVAGTQRRDPKRIPVLLQQFFHFWSNNSSSFGPPPTRSSFCCWLSLGGAVMVWC